MVATIRLLPNASQKGTVSNTSAAWEKKFAPGSRGGMRSRTTELSWLATMNDHQSGKTDPRTNASSRP